MTKVTAQMSGSLDGFHAGPRAVDTPKATHVRDAGNGRARLEFDSRGRDED